MCKQILKEIVCVLGTMLLFLTGCGNSSIPESKPEITNTSLDATTDTTLEASTTTSTIVSGLGYTMEQFLDIYQEKLQHSALRFSDCSWTLVNQETSITAESIYTYAFVSEKTDKYTLGTLWILLSVNNETDVVSSVSALSYGLSIEATQFADNKFKSIIEMVYSPLLVLDDINYLKIFDWYAANGYKEVFTNCKSTNGIKYNIYCKENNELNVSYTITSFIPISFVQNSN